MLLVERGRGDFSCFQPAPARLSRSKKLAYRVPYWESTAMCHLNSSVGRVRSRCTLCLFFGVWRRTIVSCSKWSIQKSQYDFLWMRLIAFGRDGAIVAGSFTQIQIQINSRLIMIENYFTKLKYNFDSLVNFLLRNIFIFVEIKKIKKIFLLIA